MTPTCFGVVPNPCFKEDFPEAPARIPRGNLLEISVNPYNGQFIVGFQRSDECVHLVERALAEIRNGFGGFGDFACPIIEAEPRSVLRAVV